MLSLALIWDMGVRSRSRHRLAFWMRAMFVRNISGNAGDCRRKFKLVRIEAIDTVDHLDLRQIAPR
jgi:hypothetical protein